MIFVRRPDFPSTLSGDFYAYMNYDREVIDLAAQAVGVTKEMIAAKGRELRCGVPYVIPVSEAGRLAELWLAAIDAFPPRRWEDNMYAFGLAVAKLDLKITLTQLADHNYWPGNRVQREMIHYCYGDEVWSKRDYRPMPMPREFGTLRLLLARARSHRRSFANWKKPGNSMTASDNDETCR